MIFWEIMIPFFAFALLMVWLGTHHTKVGHRQKLEELQQLEKLKLAANSHKADGDRLARQDARVEQLEDRVQVLERIITDRGYDVATQIEALRDARQDSAADQKLGRQPERQR